MILLCLIGILLSLGLTFRAAFTHFLEPGIAAAALDQVHLILCQSPSDLTSAAGAPVPCFVLQGGDPEFELVAEGSPPRTSGLVARE